MENVSCMTPRVSEDPEYAEDLWPQQAGPTAQGAATPHTLPQTPQGCNYTVSATATGQQDPWRTHPTPCTHSDACQGWQPLYRPARRHFGFATWSAMAQLSVDASGPIYKQVCGARRRQTGLQQVDVGVRTTQHLAQGSRWENTSLRAAGAQQPTRQE